MPSAADLRAELKVMRSEHPDHVPVSKMKVADVMGAIERMRHITETTPAVAQSKKVKMAKAESESDEEAPKKAAAPKMSMADRMAKIRAMKKKD